MSSRELKVGFGAASLRSLWNWPEETELDGAVLWGHGAGGNMLHPLLEYLSRMLAENRFLSVRFNFLYREAGRRIPDPPERLKGSFLAVSEEIQRRIEPGIPLFWGGKSMGGRIASLLAAQGHPTAGLILLGYPLHPARQPEKLRVGHFPSIKTPTLFVQGTRDALCDLALLHRHLPELGAPSSVHLVHEGDHSFSVPRKSGRTSQDLFEEVTGAVMGWLGQRISERGKLH